VQRQLNPRCSAIWQGICYGQGAGLGTENTQLPNGGPTLAQQQKATRDASYPSSPDAPSGH